MLSFKEIAVGQALPEREFTATNVSLFCYNAVSYTHLTLPTTPYV